jgi:hypothetical protein
MRGWKANLVGALGVIASGAMLAALAGLSRLSSAEVPGGEKVIALSAEKAIAAAAPDSTAALPAQPDPIGALKLQLARVDSEAALLAQAPLVVQAHPVGAAGSHPTGRTAEGGRWKIVHYVQRLHTIETFKGQAPSQLRIVLPGADPLPPAKDPVNETLPGPLAEDEAYVLFLRPTALSGLYTVVGGWQGIYPIGDEGLTIALEGAGFPQLGGLTPAELRKRLRTGKRE